jgi:hypothetical protein
MSTAATTCDGQPALGGGNWRAASKEKEIEKRREEILESCCSSLFERPSLDGSRRQGLQGVCAHEFGVERRSGYIYIGRRGS